MNKLLLTTVSLLFAVNAQSAHAEGIGSWFKGVFSNEESIESAQDGTDVDDKIMEGPYNDNEENDTPYKENDSSSDKTEEQTDVEEDAEPEQI